VIVGVGQLVGRDVDPDRPRDPLAALREVARRAAADAGAGDALLREVDTCGLVEVIGWSPRNAPQLLAESLGARSRRHWITATGGEIGLTLLGRACEAVARGSSRVALVAGCNLMQTLQSTRARGHARAWPEGGHGEPELVGASRWGTSEEEQRHGMRMPTDIYPLFETALRARRGLDPETHMQRVGALMSRFTEVAAKNPYAWFPVFRSADELVRPTPRNRMIAWPYPKYLNAVLATDQAAAAIVTDAETARALGVPSDRLVHWWGGAGAQERAWFVSERPDLATSPALRAAATAALARAGIESLDEIDLFDFYSCFPVAVEMACDMLGLAESDARGFTVTGGLPYAGGPGSAYTLHAVAALVERLRERPGSRGLVTGNGWYLTKHSAAVLASAPRERAPRPAPEPELPAPQPLATRAAGRAQVETCTVVYDREGAPQRGIVLARLQTAEGAPGPRVLAMPPPERDVLEALVQGEPVGRAGRVRWMDDHHRFDPT